jgi:2-hydroxychromene-2-carboxylate isomerase
MHPTQKTPAQATVAYYFTPVSPWAYLGHARFVQLAQQAQARVEVLPVDYGVIFPQSGGLPLAKRAPQRQAYRLTELRRFSQHLGVPLNLQPKFFPADATPAARLLVAVDLADGPAAALNVCGVLMRAVWADELNIADSNTLLQALAQCGLPGARLAEAQSADVEARFVANTQRALDAGVFGAPSYVLDGEIFWGQDRLEFLRQRLAPAPATAQP